MRIPKGACLRRTARLRFFYLCPGLLVSYSTLAHAGSLELPAIRFAARKGP